MRFAVASQSRSCTGLPFPSNTQLNNVLETLDSGPDPSTDPSRCTSIEIHKTNEMLLKCFSRMTTIWRSVTTMTMTIDHGRIKSIFLKKSNFIIFRNFVAECRRPADPDSYYRIKTKVWHISFLSLAWNSTVNMFVKIFVFLNKYSMHR